MSSLDTPELTTRNQSATEMASSSPANTRTSLRPGDPYVMTRACKSCGLIVIKWQARRSAATDEIYGKLCPFCHGITDGSFRQYHTDVNRHFQCPDRCYPTASPQRLCLCPCECIDDEDPDDTDFVLEDESDDELHERLPGKSEESEQILTRRCGNELNVILNNGIAGQRTLPFESAAHSAMARMHDIGLPAESSLANCENTIGCIEAQDLQRPLAPWEAEAVHHITGRPYIGEHDALSRTFHEIENMELPSGWVPSPPPQTHMFCPRCMKSTSDGFWEALRGGQVMICIFCGMPQRPLNPADDPDWHEFSPAIPGAMDFCFCRCECERKSFCLSEHATVGEYLNVLESELHPAFTSGELHIESASEFFDDIDMADNAVTDPPFARRQTRPTNDMTGAFVSGGPLTPNSPQDPAFSPHVYTRAAFAPPGLPPVLAHAQEESIRGYAVQEIVRRLNLLVRFELQDIAFSDEEDPRARDLEEVRCAVDDAIANAAVGDLEEAFRYAAMAHSRAHDFATVAGGVEPPILAEASRVYRHIANLVLEEENEGVGTTGQ